VAKRIKDLVVLSPDSGDLSCSDAKTAEILDISLKTLQRLDARGAGPKYFMVGCRKRRTLGAIRKFQEQNAA